MKKIFASLSLILSLVACSAVSQNFAVDPPEAFGKLSESEAEAQLSQAQSEMDELDKEIRGAESRRDNAMMRQGTDATMGAAVEGSEADLASLQSRKGGLIHRKLLLEKRLRELQSDN